MNTTYYWRANASLLLSQDFLRILKGHLREGGVLAYNSTGSTHVFATAERVLNDVYRYANFVVAGERIEIADPNESLRRILTMSFAQSQAINPTDDVARRKAASLPGNFKKFSTVSKPVDDGAEIITDQNLITEYKYGVIADRIRARLPALRLLR